MKVYKCNCNARTCKVCGPRMRYHEKKKEKVNPRPHGAARPGRLTKIRDKKGIWAVVDKSKGLTEHEKLIDNITKPHIVVGASGMAKWLEEPIHRVAKRIPDHVEVRDHTGLGLDVGLSREGKALVLNIRSPERETGFQRILLSRVNQNGPGEVGTL